MPDIDPVNLLRIPIHLPVLLQKRNIKIPMPLIQRPSRHPNLHRPILLAPLSPRPLKINPRKHHIPHFSLILHSPIIPTSGLSTTQIFENSNFTIPIIPQGLFFLF